MRREPEAPEGGDFYHFRRLPPKAASRPPRPQASARDVGVGFIGDMNYSIVRRLNRKWSLRAGYNLIWISGVALAPNQFDFSNTNTITLAGASNVFLHGANLGLEAQW